VRVIFASIYRGVLVIIGASVGVLTVLIETQIVHWSPWVVASVAITLGVVTCVDNVRLLAFKFQAHERGAARSRMHQPLVGALNAVAVARGVPLDKLGISVFAIRRGIGMKWWFIPWRVERLKRVFRFRLSNYPPPSPVRWTKGKGTIGECWQTGIKAIHDRRSAAARYGRGNHPTGDRYEGVAAIDRCGFTESEFIQTIDKYGEILAVPITEQHSGELIGVLSIDCLLSAYTPAVVTILDGDDIEEIAGGAAFTVRDDVPRF